jgi:hypothetical protein
VSTIFALIRAIVARPIWLFGDAGAIPFGRAILSSSRANVGDCHWMGCNRWNRDPDCPATFAESADMNVEAGGQDNGKRA